MGFFSNLFKPQDQIDAEQELAATRFQALPIEMQSPRLLRVASRLMRLYMVKADGRIQKERELYSARLKALGIAEPPTNLKEAQALVRKVGG
jgi:hypothetical protein